MIVEGRARDILDAVVGRRLLVVGDVMVDRYVSGRVTRISPEAPVPVVQVVDDRSRPGGAANVALNIRALGGEVVLAGVVGDDAGAEVLRGLFRDAGIGGEGLVVLPGRRTTEKTRVLAERQQVVRIDREDGGSLSAEELSRFEGRLRELVAGVDGVIIEDYGKGVVSQPVVDCVLGHARRAGIPVSLDPKDNHALNFEWLSLATPNYKEACDAVGVPQERLDEGAATQARLLSLARRLQDLWHTDFLAITLGAHGMFLHGRADAPKLIPTRAREVFDVCGAGDTVIAAATLALVAGATHEEAVSLANYAAGIVVGKIGAATCSPAELMAFVSDDLAEGGR